MLSRFSLHIQSSGKRENVIEEKRLSFFSTRKGSSAVLILLGKKWYNIKEASKVSMSHQILTESTLPAPLLILINGPSAVGKTTLATRLGADLGLAVLHKDGFYETLFD
jgi:2-phosphoglycerate kinase